MSTNKTVSIIEEVAAEAARGRRKHGGTPFASLHEGYAVLLEEVRELEEAIFRDQPLSSVRIEAVQVAAMALRIIAELCCEGGVAAVSPASSP